MLSKSADRLWYTVGVLLIGSLMIVSFRSQVRSISTSIFLSFHHTLSDIFDTEKSKVMDHMMFTGTLTKQFEDVSQPAIIKVSSKFGLESKVYINDKEIFRNDSGNYVLPLDSYNENDAFRIVFSSTNDITNLSGLFEMGYDDGLHSPIKTLRMTINTHNVVNMSGMFSGLRLLDSLDLGPNFDTVNVEHMEYMFTTLSNLRYLSLGSKFNTSKVYSMGGMFGWNRSLVSLDLGVLFDMSNVFEYDDMFKDTINVETLIYSITYPLKVKP